MENTNHAPKQLFDMNEENLKNFHQMIGETIAECEDHDGQKDLERQAEMVRAIGAWRFPDTWSDGLAV
jgi:hypothetical protein